MNKLSKITAALLLAGTATLAAAQTLHPDKAKAFADELAVLQSYSGTGSMYHPAPSTFSQTSQDPATALTATNMQARSDESSMYQSDHGNVHPSNGPTFAQANPHGLRISYYQAASSHDDEWKLPASAGARAYATASAGAAAAIGTAATPAKQVASR